MAELDTAPIITDDDSHGLLTYGVELEFLVPYVKYGYEDPNPEDGRPVFHALSKDWTDFADAFVGFILYHLRTSTGIPFRNADDDIYVPPHDNVPYYNEWRLVYDMSCTGGTPIGDQPEVDQIMAVDGPEAYDFRGFEVTSRVLRIGGDCNGPSEIDRVCRALRNMRVHLNCTTGVHVHIGRANKGFTLLTMKKFATLIWLVDPLLLALHHNCRTSSSSCKSLRQHAALATDACYATTHISRVNMREMATWVPGFADLSHQIAEIWDEEGIEGIARMMAVDTGRRSQRGAVGFSRFLPSGRDGGNLNTFEFRQMGGSLSPIEIVNWVVVGYKLVDFARLSDQAEYNRLLHNIQTRENYSGIDLLLDLDLRNEAAFFHRKAEQRQQSTSDMPCSHYEGGNTFVPRMR